jgi:hypothetical protein
VGGAAGANIVGTTWEALIASNFTVKFWRFQVLFLKITGASVKNVTRRSQNATLLHVNGTVPTLGAQGGGANEATGAGI